MQENQISRVCFELSAFNRTRHDVLFQSFFGRMKMPRRTGIKSRMLPQVKMFSDLNVFVGWQNGGKGKTLAIEPCTFLSDKSLAQHLDTVIANLTAESLNFWLIKFVEELCKENGHRYPHGLLCSIVCTIR